MQGRSELPGEKATALPDETRRSAAGSHDMRATITLQIRDFDLIFGEHEVNQIENMTWPFPSAVETKFVFVS